MAAIVRRSIRCPIGINVALATADDLDGVQDLTQTYDVTGAQRVLIMQFDDGTPGTAGIDIVEISHDGGNEWAADTTVLPITANDMSGTVQALGALNAAGVEPATVRAGIFKAGPYEGPTLIRIGRDTTGGLPGGTDWSTGAPSVDLLVIGGPAGGGAPAAEA